MITKMEGIPSDNAKKIQRIQQERQTIQAELDVIFTLESQIATRIEQGSQLTAALDLDPQTGERIKLTEENISKRIEMMAKKLTEEMPHARPLLIGIADGGVAFLMKLCEALKRLNYSFQYSILQASSYGGNESSGELKISSKPKTDPAGKTVVVVDDVIESGLTLKKIKDYLMIREAAKDVKSMVLYNKAKEREFNADFVGFNIDPNEFLIGGGMDYEITGGSKYCRDMVEVHSLIDHSIRETDEEKVILRRKPHLQERLKELAVKECRLNQKLAGKPAEPCSSSNTGRLFSPPASPMDKPPASPSMRILRSPRHGFSRGE